MIHNYLKVALRNLVKQKFYSLINITGLAIGLACLILISLYVIHELSYDKHHLYSKEIFRVGFHLKFGGKEAKYAVAPAPLAEAIREEIPEALSATRFRSWGSFLIKRDVPESENIKQNGVIWTDPNVFDVFTIPLIKGNPEICLQDPNTVIISQSAAYKYFSDEDPINQSLILNNDMLVKITGVYEDMPENSHFKFDVMLSMKGLEESKSQMWLSNNFHTYFVLNKGADPDFVLKKLNDMLYKYAGEQVKQVMGFSMEEFKEQGNMAEFFVQPLTSIHLESDLTAEISPNSDFQYIYIFSAIAIFILILACVNFMNLSTARSSDRAKEVGIRKVLGSYRIHLIRLFLSESIVISLISILFSIVIAQVLLSSFNNLAGTNLEIPYASIEFWIFIIGGGIFIGLLAGIYPSFFLSSFKPITILHGNRSKGSNSGLIRNLLVIFQFSISIVLIIGTIAVYNQLNYIQNKRLGFDKDQVIILHDTFVLDQQIESFKNEILNNPEIISGTVSGFLPVDNSNRNNTSFWKKGESTADNSINLQKWRIDHDYIGTLGMRILTGRDFFKDIPSDSSGIIINEKAADVLGWDDPIGKEIQTFRSSNTPDSFDPEAALTYRIIGVVENFHWESLKQNVGSLCMVLESSTNKISFKFNIDDTKKVINILEVKWKEIAADQPFQYSFLDDEFGRMYETEEKTGQLFTVFAILAIFIASLGLFALAAFMAEKRIKEIGIRKVLGASTISIVIMFSRDFGRLVLIAFVIAVPIAWYVVKLWLQSFAYREAPGFWIYAGSGIISLFIAWLTVSYQSLKAAISNPVNSLRDE
jgi:putative ABC transport system permease protein